MFKTTFIIVMAALCLFFKVNGQRPANINPLKIGDSIPDAIWNLPLTVVNHPTGQQSITLGEYKNKKLIILDFWATYCSPCIKSLHKLDTIQKEVGESTLAVLPVLAFDDAERALPFIQTTNWNWPSVVNDTFLRTPCFSKYLTGFGTVWISEGKLIAIPKNKHVNTANVLKAIGGKPLQLENKKEQHILKL